jgi:hypothetical protein
LRPQYSPDICADNRETKSRYDAGTQRFAKRFFRATCNMLSISIDCGVLLLSTELFYILKFIRHSFAKPTDKEQWFSIFFY